MASSKMTPFLTLHPTSTPVIDKEVELECFGETGELPESICICVCVCWVHDGYFSIWSEHAPLRQWPESSLWRLTSAELPGHTLRVSTMIYGPQYSQ